MFDAQEHINSFVRPALADLQDDPAFQYVYVSLRFAFRRASFFLSRSIAKLTSLQTQINLQENPLKSFLVTMFLSSLRKTIPPSQQPTYLLSHQSLEYLREPMGMMNKHVGYVFLVDWEGRIRWAGCSWATADEEESLRRCGHVLVERLKKGVTAP